MSSSKYTHINIYIDQVIERSTYNYLKTKRVHGKVLKVKC